MSTIKLTYFDGPGRGEPIRIALFLGGIAFEDHRVKFPEFMASKLKGEYPLGSVPVLEIDGHKICQTSAILRYIARIGDTSLYPTDPIAALRVDSALDTMNDTLSAAMLPSFFERDMAKKLAMRAELAAGPLARAFHYIEGLIEASGGPYVGGKAMSIADIVIGQQIAQIRGGTLDGLTEEILTPFPRIGGLTINYLAETKIVGYANR